VLSCTLCRIERPVRFPSFKPNSAVAPSGRDAENRIVLRGSRLFCIVGIAFVPFFAIAGTGRHDGPVARQPAELAQVAEAHGATAAQIRIAWTLHQGPHVLAIPGTGNPDHLAENVAAGAIRLSPAELARLGWAAHG
jgi:diketogulonate reductase-like aldo/keto reductase